MLCPQDSAQPFGGKHAEQVVQFLCGAVEAMHPAALFLEQHMSQVPAQVQDSAKSVIRAQTLVRQRLSLCDASRSW